MAKRRNHYWWFPFALGVLRLVRNLLLWFDPSAATVYPYNFLELYAEMPQFRILGSGIGILMGLVGLMSVIVVEFARSRPGEFRPLRGPWYRFAFGLVMVGFVLDTLDAGRGAHIVPNLAHCYYAQDGRLQDIAAIILQSTELDYMYLFSLVGNGVWGLVLAIDFYRAQPTRWYMAVASTVFAAANITYHVLMQFDAGKQTLILTPFLYVLVIPAWYISMAFHIRRNAYETESAD